MRKSATYGLRTNCPSSRQNRRSYPISTSRSPPFAARTASAAHAADRGQGLGPDGDPLGGVTEEALDDEHAGLGHRAVVGDGELAYLEASVLVGGEEPLCGEVEERLADGCRGDPVLLGDLLDGELPARRKTPCQHLVTQRVGDLLAQGVARHTSARTHMAPIRPTVPVRPRSPVYPAGATSGSGHLKPGPPPCPIPGTAGMQRGCGGTRRGCGGMRTGSIAYGTRWSGLLGVRAGNAVTRPAPCTCRRRRERRPGLRALPWPPPRRRCRPGPRGSGSC